MRERERKCVRDSEIDEKEFSKRRKSDVSNFGGTKYFLLASSFNLYYREKEWKTS